MALYPSIDWVRQSPLFNTARDDILDNTSYKCASDASGNFYFVYRTFGGGVASGQISPGTSGDRDIILVKMDSNGNTLYVKQTAISGAGNDTNPSIAVDSSGNIYISCITSGTLSGTTEVNVGNHNELAIIKLDTDGNVLWIKQDNTITPSTGGADHSSIAVDNNGFVYVGINAGAVISGGSHIGGNDVVIMKLSADTGARQWLTSGNMLSSAGTEDTPNIAVVNQSLYLLYRTQNTSSILGGAAVVGGNDLVLSKFSTADGSRVWIQTGPALSTTQSDNDNSMAVDQNENVYISYSINPGVISGGTAVGGNDIIVLKFDSNGNRLWAHQNASTSTTTNEANGPRIAVDYDGDAYIVYVTNGGVAGDAGDFDPVTGQFIGAAHRGGNDVVVAKLSGATGARIWATQKTIVSTTTTETLPFISIVPGTKTARVVYQTSGAVTGGTNLQRPVADAIVCEFDSTGTRTAVFQGPTFNTTGTEAPIVTRLDSAGNMYVAYITTGGAVSGGGTTANSDVVIAKFNSSRVLQWARQNNTISTPQTESQLAIAVDSAQNVFVAYNSSGTVSGGVATLGSSDIIFIKLNSSGNRLWTLTAAQNAILNTSAAQDRPQLEIDPSGNVYMAYRSAGAVSGGTATGSNDIVVAKFDTNGNRTWVRQDNTISTATDDSNPRIAVSSSGEVYLTYITNPSGALSGGVAHSTIQTSVILIKLNSSGAREWFVHDNNINSAPGFLTTSPSVCLDPSGNVYITVQTANAVAGATTSAGTFARADIAVVKYNSTGVKQWAVQTANMNTGLLEQAPEIISDITGGNVYVAYRTSGTSSGNTRPDSDYLTKTDQDLIITKISWAGVVEWTRQNGTFNTFETETSQSIAVSGDGNKIFLAFQGFPLDGGAATMTNSSDMVALQMTEQTLPTQPYNLSVSNVSSSSVTLQWTIDSLGTAPLNGYYMSMDRKYAASGSAPLPSNFIPIANVTSLGSNQYSTTLTLSGDGDYTISIWASTGFAPSPTSASVSFITNTTEPSAPQNLAASGKDGTLYLTWDHPATGFAASYIVTLTGGITRTVTAPFTSFTGLATGTAYTATVKAANTAFPSGATATASTTYTIPTTPLSAPVVEWIKQDVTINTTASEQFVSGSSTAASQLAKDSSGNVYITFTTAGVLSGIGAGNFDVALAKISPSGERLWAIQRVISTSGSDDGSALAVDASNNVILAYRAQNPGVVSGGTLIGGSDMVVIKLDSNGNILWTKQDITTNSINSEDGFNVITDKENSIYIGYYTSGTVSGGMANRGQHDAVILKLDSSGNRVFMKQDHEINDSGFQNSPYIAVDDALNMYVLLRSTTPVSGGTAALGSDDVILLKYNKYGVREWVAPTVLTGSTTQEFSRNTIKVDKGGNIYITYANTGGGVVSGGSILVGTGTNIFLQKFDTNGNRIWINNSSVINTTSPNQHQQIDIDEDGNVYLCYSTNGTVSGLGAPRGGYNIIVSKFDTNGNRVWGLNSSALNTAADETMTNIVVYSQNQIYIAYQTVGATSGQTYFGSNDIVVARIGQYFTPDAPTDLAATPGDASVSLTFTAPVYTGGSAITNYKYSLNGGTTFTAFSPAQTTSPVTITGLTNGQTYNIQLEASNAAIDGLNSATVTVTPRTVPQAPTNLVATPGDQSVSIAFTAPNNGGSAITNYKYSIDGGATFTAFSPAITASPAVITGLTNGTSYDIQIEAVNAVGDGLNSATVTATPRTTPQAPTSLVATPGDSIASLTFTAPSSDGGSPITNYKYSIDGGATFTAFSPAITASPAVITGLTNGTTYTIKILAVNAAGDGSASTQVTATLKTIPQAPTNLVATPGDQSVSIAFTAPNDGGSAITNYKYSLDGGATFTAFSPAITASPAVITGLTNGQTYNIQLEAVNEMGDGLNSATVTATPRTTAQAPTNLVATLGNQSVSVAFTAPNDGGSAITNYKYSINGGSTFTAFSPAITASPAVITGLTNGQSYTIELKAVNAAGDGPASSQVTAVPVTAPGMPAGLFATPGNQSVSIAFTAPNDGGSPITNYEYSIDGGSIYVLFSPPQTSSPVTISNLTNGTSYAIKLRAVNAVDSGAASSSVTVTPRTTPSAPQSIFATPGDSSVSIAFTLASTGGSPITNYMYSIDGGSTFAVFSPPQTSSPLTITGLTNGQSYTFKIKAVNAAGEGLTSAQATTTPVTTPSAPTSLVATPTDGAISLAFTEPTSNGGSSITNYKLSTDGGVTFTALSPAQTTSPIAISGLTNGRTYQLQLKAVNAVGDSSASSQVSAMPVASSQPEPTTVQGLLEYVEDLKIYLSSFVNPPAPILSVPAVPVTTLITTAAPAFNVNATYTIKFVLPENGGQSIVSADIAAGEIVYVPTTHGVVFPLTVDGTLYVLITGETSIAVNSVEYDVGDTVVLGNKLFRVVFTGSVGLMAQNNDANIYVPCIVGGQRVLTPEGYRNVETLKDGNLIVTGEGRHVPVKVYRSSIAKTTIHTAPISITMNDKIIRLSPHHAYKIHANGWMIPSAALTGQINGVTQDEIGQRVVYYHLETPNYLRDDIVLDGCVVESYGRNYIKAHSIRMCELYVKSKHGEWYERMKPTLRSRNVPR
jgi:hypothetical protein